MQLQLKLRAPKPPLTRANLFGNRVVNLNKVGAPALVDDRWRVTGSILQIHVENLDKIKRHNQERRPSLSDHRLFFSQPLYVSWSNSGFAALTTTWDTTKNLGIELRLYDNYQYLVKEEELVRRMRQVAEKRFVKTPAENTS